MLKPDQARAELDKVHHKDGAKRRLAALGQLPKKLAELGRGLLGRDARGKPIEDWSARAGSQEAARIRLNGLPARERRPLLEALFPHLGIYVDAAWDLTYHLPYETDFERKPFRAPNDPAVTRPARGTWFGSLLRELEGYEQDITWLAEWAGYLSSGYSADAVGLLLAAAVNAGGKESDGVFEILCDSARDCHPVGGMGRHVSRALLIGSRLEGWEFMERLLLAVQDQEGLRQSILETIGEAHPEAFRRMLRLIVEHDLARHEAVVRALNVWFGFQWGAVSPRVVQRVLERVIHFLEEPQAQANALESDDSETVYLALWTMAFEDAPATVAPAAALLSDPNVERRFIAVHLLSQLHLPDARVRLAQALADSDLRVALAALEGCEIGAEEEPGKSPGLDLFGPLERLLARMPEKKKLLDPIVWPWHVFSADRQAVADSLIQHLGDRPPAVLVPYLPSMESGTRRLLIEQLAGLKRWDEQTRDALFSLAGDSSLTVREAAFRALARCKIDAREAAGLEDLLSRKAGDLRRGVLTLLLQQKDSAALASADRLLAAPDLARRQAGLEMLRQLIEAGRLAGECRARAEEYRAQRPRLTEEERKLLDSISGAGRARGSKRPQAAAALKGY